MKKALFFIMAIAAVLFPSGAKAATEWTYAELTVPGDLVNILGENAREIEALEIVGPLDDTDFHTLWECVFHGKLSSINMREAELIDGAIPDYAFCNPEIQKTDSGFPVYSNLESIALPKNVRSIGKMAFACTKLQSDFNTVPAGVTTVGDGAFMHCPLTYFYFPATCSHIGKEVLRGCVYLTNVEIPGATIIPEGLCKGCITLKSITLPEGVISIGKSAFSMCRNLKVINLPEGLERIEENAFTSTSPEKVVLPSTLSYIGDWAFGSILSMPQVYSLATVPPTCCAVNDIGPFFPERINSVRNSLTLYVPENCASTYAGLSGWNQFDKIEEMTELGGIGSVTDNEGSATVAASGRAIEINGYSGSYEVFDLSGRTVASGTASGRVTVECPAGVYIVKTAGNVTKIRIL